MTQAFVLFFSVSLGLIIGSFLSVCVYRIPLGRGSGLDELEGDESDTPKEKKEPDKKITVASPSRSFCPKCEKQLRWWHNIPVVSWLLLGGKCAFCKHPISMRYPLLEILSAFFCFLSFTLFGFSLTAVVLYLFCAALLVISFIDIDYYIIPNVISYPGTVLAILLAVLNQYTGLFAFPIVPNITDSLLGILAGAGFLLLISEGYLRLRKKHGLGLGDVKLLAMTGALLGYQGALYTIFVGSLLGSVIGLLMILLFRRKANHYIPFGPYLALASVLYIFTDLWLIQYLFSLISPAGTVS